MSGMSSLYLYWSSGIGGGKIYSIGSADDCLTSFLNYSSYSSTTNSVLYTSVLDASGTSKRSSYTSSISETSDTS